VENTMEKIKGCIFDLDGVIVDTAKYHFLAWKRLADELNIDFTEEDNERFKGVSRMKCLDILLEIGNIQLDSNEKHYLAEKKNNWYLEYISKINKSDILPGTLDFINRAKKSGLKIGLGSASKNTMAILRGIDLVSEFDSIVDGNRVSKAKPDPEVFLLCAKDMGLTPQSCVVFEDAYAGILAAKNANMLAIGIGSASILKKADKVIPSFDGITIDILNSL
jgi:beta-phosphoglucomutase